MALRGVDADLKISSSLVKSLEQQSAAAERRLDRLASLRAGYGNLVEEVHHREELVKKAQKDLADARASVGAAKSSSLITLVDEPHVGSRPEGPGRTAIVLSGIVGGLAIGFGLVFLTLPTNESWGRRLSDRLGFGRRAADRQTPTTTAAAVNARTVGRRAEDQQPARCAGDCAGGHRRRRRHAPR